MWGHMLGWFGEQGNQINTDYSTVWSVVAPVIRPTDICHVQSVKISLKIHHCITQHNYETRSAEMSVAFNYFIMSNLRAKAKCQVMQVIESFALRAEKRVARSKLRGERWRQDTAGSAVQSSRQDLKRKVWLFEWFD